MAVSYELIRAPFSESLIGEIHGLAERVFGTGIDDGGTWRFENMPDFTVIEASLPERFGRRARSQAAWLRLQHKYARAKDASASSVIHRSIDLTQ